MSLRIGLLLPLLLPFVAKAETDDEIWENARKVMKSRAHCKSLSQCLSKAQDGDVKAQYITGNAYRVGPDAENIYYFKVKEVDNKKALFWLNMAAQNENVNAMNSLSKLYSVEATNNTRDFEKAKRWASKCVDKGETDCHFVLGVIAEANGDYTAARSHYQKTTLHRKAKYQMAMLHFYGKGGAVDYKSANDILSGIELDRFGPAYRVRGLMAINGLGQEKDVRLGLSYLRQAIEYKEFAAYEDIGELYYTGNGVEKNYETAFSNFSAIVSMQRPKTMRYVALMAYYGQGVEKKVDHAIVLFEAAANKGDVTSAWALGRIYLSGEDIEKNEELGFHLVKFAAERNHPEAQYGLGYLYSSGIGVEKNAEEARRWLTLAAKNGNKMAIEALK